MRNISEYVITSFNKFIRKKSVDITGAAARNPDLLRALGVGRLLLVLAAVDLFVGGGRAGAGEHGPDERAAGKAEEEPDDGRRGLGANSGAADLETEEMCRAERGSKAERVLGGAPSAAARLRLRHTRY